MLPEAQWGCPGIWCHSGHVWLPWWHQRSSISRCGGQGDCPSPVPPPPTWLRALHTVSGIGFPPPSRMFRLVSDSTVIPRPPRSSLCPRVSPPHQEDRVWWDGKYHLSHVAFQLKKKDQSFPGTADLHSKQWRRGEPSQPRVPHRLPGPSQLLLL